MINCNQTNFILSGIREGQMKSFLKLEKGRFQQYFIGFLLQTHLIYWLLT